MLRPGALLSRAHCSRTGGFTVRARRIESNAVSVYIHQLRRKLGADISWHFQERSARRAVYFCRCVEPHSQARRP